MLDSTTAALSGTNSRTLIDLNERLTKQIEQNLSVFDNLNQELSVKERALVQGQAQINEREREVKKLKDQVKSMDENMKRLI